MLDRLGNVLYWAGCIAAGLTVLLGLILMQDMQDEKAVVFIFFVVVAAGFWLVGRALQYILSG
jgi:hypothetical protein